MYIIVAVLVVVIVVAAVAAYVVINNNANNSNPSPTATPTTSPTAGNGVDNATTLSFSASIPSQGLTYNWSGKNIHGNDITIRVDFATYSYIMDAGQEKSWNSTDSGSTWTQSSFVTDWPNWGAQWNTYVSNLAHWSGTGNYTYTDPSGASVTLSNIQVNPTIPDSTFTAS